MEVIISIGIGAWFVLTSAVSCIAVFRSFGKNKPEDKKK